MIKVGALTAIAMMAFAANSLFARLALLSEGTSAAGYTGLRLVSGAITLALLVLAKQGSLKSVSGSWRSAMALLVYAVAFSFAYVMLGVATGALVLFASVQIGILGLALFKGERPGPFEWCGLSLAFASLVYLVAPGLQSPPFLGSFLMAGAGFAWAVYTLLGRGSRSPLTDTAGNFLRCAPIGLILMVFGGLPSMPWESQAYAIASGALASALGYAVWYLVLPHHTRVSAGLVQLTVPAIAAAAGALFVSEPITARIVLASIGILSGVALALFAAEARSR